MSLRGDIKNLPLWEVLQLLSSGRKTGKFEIIDGQNKGDIYFKDGKIIYAKLGNLENWSALLELTLWENGEFAFYPEEEYEIQSINIDPFELLITSERYLDLMEYLEDFILVPIKRDNLNEHENEICNLFNGIRKVKEVVREFSLGKIKALEIIEKLMKDKVLVIVRENEKLNWFYLFWSGWKYVLDEFPKKGLGERKIKGEWRKFLDKNSSKVKTLFEKITFPEEVSRLYFYRYMKEEYTPDLEEVMEIFEDVIKGEEVLWDNVYKNLINYDEKEVKNFVKSSLQFLFSLGKTKMDDVLDVVKIAEFSQFIDKNLDGIYLFVKKYDNFEEEFFFYLFDGKRTLKNILEDSIFDNNRTKLFFGKLLKDEKVISRNENEKINLIYSFWEYWNEIQKYYKEQNLESTLKEQYEKFLEENVQDVKYIFEKILRNLYPNWIYIYKKSTFYTFEEIRGFVKNLLENIRKIGGDLKINFLNL